jgi:hypothetical protein
LPLRLIDRPIARAPSAFSRAMCAVRAAVACALALPAAHAQDAEYREFEHRHALGGKVGTTGLGLEYSYAWSEFPQFGVRVNANAGSYSRDATRRNVRYDGKAEFR